MKINRPVIVFAPVFSAVMDCLPAMAAEAVKADTVAAVPLCGTAVSKDQAMRHSHSAATATARVFHLFQ